MPFYGHKVERLYAVDWSRELWALAARRAASVRFCNLNRSIDQLIERAGFRIMELERGYNGGRRPFTYKGLAQHPAGRN